MPINNSYNIAGILYIIDKFVPFLTFVSIAPEMFEVCFTFYTHVPLYALFQSVEV